MEDKFKSITAAYTILSDKDKKALYDNMRAGEQQGQYRAQADQTWSYTQDAGGYKKKTSTYEYHDTQNMNE
jgi:DnaJ-class molecular chaperone